MFGASVRSRAAISAAAVVAAALAVAGFGLVSLLRGHLQQSAQDAAGIRARDVASTAAAGRLPPQWIVTDDEKSLVQVVSPTGRVIASSTGLSTVRLSSRAPVGPTMIAFTLTGVPVDPDERFRVVAMAVQSPAGRDVIYSGESLEAADDAASAVARTLVLEIPALVALVAGLTWWSVRRALRPVEAIRGQMAEITSHDLRRRVPEPTSRDEVRRLAVTTNATLDRLEAAVERERALVADASHELRTPLASLRAELEIALAAPHRADWPTTARNALADAKRMEALARDLLLLARLDSNPTRHHKPVNLVELVTASLHARRHLSTAELSLSIEATPTIDGDELQIRRLVDNLCDNAVRHAASQVEVHIRQDPDTATVTIWDDGPGIAQQDRTRVFDRFTRLDEHRSRDSGGAGLGLAIARKIAESHGGKIVVGDSIAGTVFIVTLPAAFNRPQPAA